jgi:hypothetical protein
MIQLRHLNRHSRDSDDDDGDRSTRCDDGYDAAIVMVMVIVTVICAESLRMPALRCTRFISALMAFGPKQLDIIRLLAS